MRSPAASPRTTPIAITSSRNLTIGAATGTAGPDITSLPAEVARQTASTRPPPQPGRVGIARACHGDTNMPGSNRRVRPVHAKLIAAATLALLAAPPAFAQPAEFAGKWRIDGAVLAPWAVPGRSDDRSEERRLVGKTVTFGPRG